MSTRAQKKRRREEHQPAALVYIQKDGVVEEHEQEEEEQRMSSSCLEEKEGKKFQERDAESTTEEFALQTEEGIAPPQQELVKLNRRLELYILKQRERDASKQGLEREFLATRRSLQEQVEQLQERLDASDRLLLTTKQQWMTERSEYEQNLHRTREELQRVQEQWERASKWESDAREWERALRQSETQLATLQEEYDDCRTRYEHAREEAREAVNDALRHHLEAQHAKEEALQWKEKWNKECTSLQSQLDGLQKHSLTLEEELRKSFGKQLQQVVREETEQLDALHQEAIRKLKEQHDTALQHMRTSWLETEHTNDRLRTQLASAEQRIEDERRTASTDRAQLHALRQEMESLRSECTKSVAQAQENERIWRDKWMESHKQLRAKDAEYQSLWDVKVTLDLELKAYRHMLQQEEERLGLCRSMGSSSSSQKESHDSQTEDGDKDDDEVDEVPGTPGGEEEEEVIPETPRRLWGWF